MGNRDACIVDEGLFSAAEDLYLLESRENLQGSGEMNEIRRSLVEDLSFGGSGEVRVRVVTAKGYDHPRLAYFSDD